MAKRKSSPIRRGVAKTSFTAGETFKGKGAGSNYSTYKGGGFKDYSLTKTPPAQMGRNSK